MTNQLLHGSKYVTNQLLHGSQYVTNTPTYERCWLQSFLVHLQDEDQEAPWPQPYGVQMQQLLQKKDELGQIVFGHNIHVTTSATTS